MHYTYNIIMENEKQNCKNCKHYLEHYIISGLQFSPIGGHCINRELNDKRKKDKTALIENCDYWESNITKKAERKETIKTVIRQMNERLKQIELILETEE